MKKAVFLIPYFGRFNNYFQLFLDSCKKNKDINWIIFTDDRRNFDFPQNVRVIYMTFDDLKNVFQNKFEFTIDLAKPYKLCDFKPAYGYLFEEYIKDYQYWGYCDTDIIFGDINRFVEEPIKLKYDKIFFLGHCTLIRNTPTLNRLFMKKLNDEILFKKVYSQEKNFSFDEEFNKSINNIFLEEKRRIYMSEVEANIYTKSSHFKLTNYNFEKKRYEVFSKKNTIFIYKDGRIWNISLRNGSLVNEEFMYIHLQSRKMQVKRKNRDYYKIIPNAFEDITQDITQKKGFILEKKCNPNFHYFKIRTKNLYIKIKRVLMK
ncbi:DUF6625 family protein [Enterococcus faecium]|uniref:DUF6625 family protein n=1 Tax=Enterococcus faecium TaxID=1352 RepID=UPI000CF2BAD6|nr:DUF6625 family protein [Enterococcus faecium]PQF67856.1 hypothetical protein CUS68_11480 [Enterococcus faecium]